MLRLEHDYRQRNRHELKCAARIAEHIGVVEHRVIQCEVGSWGGRHNRRVFNRRRTRARSPNTYVPARNLIFLSTALGWAEVLDARDIFFGANAADHDHFPDCREAFFAAFTHAANLATRAGIESDFSTYTPR